MIRPFDGSLAQAEGVLSVERATFDESPYTAEGVRAMLTAGPQRAWLALAGQSVVGFVIAFLTETRHASWWEIDLLAVHPAWRGRGLGSRLVHAALVGGSGLAGQARAVVADDNDASVRAFLGQGFQAAPVACSLLIYRPGEQPARQRPACGRRAMAEVKVREEIGSGWTLLGAEWAGQPAGSADLVEVQTLLYRGLWIESLQAVASIARVALIQRAVARAVDAGLDEIGAMVPDGDRSLHQALVAAGFRSLGRFRWVTAPLPLPRRDPDPLSCGANTGCRPPADGGT